MDALLTNFIRALRNADVRISTAETLDAFKAAQLVGYADRARLKDSLALTLPKTIDEKAAFDACFDQFFSFHQSRPLNPFDGTDASLDDAAPAAGSQASGGGESGSQGTRADSAASAAAQAEATPQTGEAQAEASGTSHSESALGQLLLRGNRMEIGMAIAAAGQRVGVERIEVFTQKGVYSRRILEAMGLIDLQAEIGTLEASTDPNERRLGHDLSRRRDWLREEVRTYVEHQFLLHADVSGRRLREDLLRTVRLSSLDHRHHRLVQDIVRRMAKRLVATYSRRRKTFKRGQLHVPRTLRRNMKYDDAIFDLHWKSVKVDRPKVFAICDVSGSVAEHARFMLTFLYSLEEVLPRVRSFAFSSDLGEVSELFQSHDLDDAIALTLKHYGGGATDYGQAFADFKTCCLDNLDSRSTVIVLGDARNNGGDTRLDVLKEIHDRCRRLIWLNPEPRSMWNTGDSEMRHVGAYSHQVEECSTLAHLQRFVTHLVQTSR
ncbi:MAG TPA: VWA domain-containing protein [Steroidobacteraceae bacterium]|nr:VWA domain-containing protein [Steroidobacteraceae bacterium]